MKRVVCVLLCVLLTLGLGVLFAGCDQSDNTACTCGDINGCQCGDVQSCQCGDVKSCQCGDVKSCQCTPDRFYADFLADKEVGYELPVYPNFEFSYFMLYDGDEYEVHINAIRVVLKSKNTISSSGINNFDQHMFSPYSYEVSAEGTVKSASNLVGKTIAVVVLSKYSFGIFAEAVIEKDGSFCGSAVYGAEDTTYFYFSRAVIQVS